MKSKWMLPVGIMLTLAAANAPADDDFSSKSKTKTMCEVVKSLIAEHKNGFQSLRGRQVGTKDVSIWKAKYHVVGNDCEIWQSDRKDSFYVCTRNAPTEDVANEYYERARTRLSDCLGKQWAQADVPRQGGGKKTTFSNKDLKPDIEIHEVKVDGVQGTQWMIYYLTGGAPKGL